MKTSVEARNEATCEFTGDVALDDHHAVRGECSRLVGANGARVAHRFTGVKMPHQVVVRHHFLYTRCQYRHKCNSKRLGAYYL